MNADVMEKQELLDEIEQLRTLLDESERKYQDERKRRLELSKLEWI